METVKTKFFAYGQREIEYLQNVDPILGAAMKRLGKIDREVIPDLFAALIYAIVGQQISVKAAYTVWHRMQLHFEEMIPQQIALATVEEIQQCGMSTRKAIYIKNIGEAVMHSRLNLIELYDLPDEEVIKRLSQINGIGVWTAEMLLLNSMERPDIVSWGDIAIRRGMMNLYNLTTITKEQFEKYKKQYSPYGSVASIYLWKLSFES
ncbi:MULTISPECIES: DNA-3-methyladenine glycosylase family protein [Pelosinus]|jgi:DNA-3-methyladenine glycosylase II|uniref:DNA-3-methyladenine glycosylase II n=1 Tax=Pelosinus fermentans B4 TaxID=1149862 RepID=I9ATX8_9FIRM|nr:MULTISPECIES: DNA-3-methyladenine glycosylase [Pelosinus]EIW16397.1 HhH-GPD family protein [Pelosinus fermentans B4]EIW22622.1 HhH-GPD family protein [Pelosinus fermentans A11]OAM95704.1 HhH-GPD family protein [Pelosinus fermentans DSM 17108]SDR31798.1 DNA-3-methyladenine glycosylase II [Pelosinus fermentans]